PQCEEDQAEAGAPRICIAAVAAKGSQSNQEDRGDDEHRPDTQLARPRDAAPLCEEGLHEPVQPERCPSDGEDELDGSPRPSWFHGASVPEEGCRPLQTNRFRLRHALDLKAGSALPTS